MRLLLLLTSCASPVSGSLPEGVYGSPDLALRVDGTGDAVFERSCGRGELGVVDVADHRDHPTHRGHHQERGRDAGHHAALRGGTHIRRVPLTLQRRLRPRRRRLLPPRALSAGAATPEMPGKTISAGSRCSATWPRCSPASWERPPRPDCGARWTRSSSPRQHGRCGPRWRPEADPPERAGGSGRRRGDQRKRIRARAPWRRSVWASEARLTAS